MINISIKGIAIVFLLHEIYYVGDFLQFQWVTPFLIEIKSNIDYLFSGNWVGLTHLFRSLLFFILLAFMVYLLQYWLIQRKKIFPFFLLTTVYITVLDTFTAYDASWAIVRTVLSGFLMMGILTLQRLRKNGKIDFQTKTTRKWLLSLLIMIVLPIGFSLPKYFFPIVSDSIIEPGWSKAVFASPMSNGKENICKKDGSTAVTVFS